MLLQYLQPKNGHVNGTRSLLESMTDNVLIFCIAIESHKEKRLILPRIFCDPGNDDFPIPGHIRTQFRIRIFLAITTNKAIGHSFSGALGIDLHHEGFTHGQLYVALSRNTHPSIISVFLKQETFYNSNVMY